MRPTRHERLLLSFTPLAGHRSGLRPARVAAQPLCCPTFRPWGASRASPAPGLRCPLLTSAGRSERISPPSVSLDHRHISPGTTPNVPRVDAGFITHTPLRMEDFAVTCPLVPGGPTPRIRFLCVAPHVWIGLPPDPTSRWTPLPFSSPSAPRSPGTRTFTSLVLCHAWHTRKSSAARCPARPLQRVLGITIVNDEIRAWPRL